MSTESKATAPKRKPAAKRGPTKAAALKALGLTQEDLDNLKVLKHVIVDESIPIDDLSVETQVSEEVTLVSTTFYARNLRGTDFGFRLSRQSERGTKRTDLKPRGQRGDLVKLQPEDLNDAELLNQVEYNCVEIITEAEARSVISKQSTNQQARQHPAMAMLRNEKGEAYTADQIKVDAEYNSQGITVAHLDPAAAQGKLSDKEISRSGGFLTNTAPGGNPGIISDGFQRQDSAAQADAVARRKDLEGPAAGLGGLNVVIEPTQRT
jgi:hypothetical protein